MSYSISALVSLIENKNNNFFEENKEAFLTYLKTFKKNASDRVYHEACYYLLHNLVLGKPLTNGFTPISNQVKIQNGALSWNKFVDAYCVLMFGIADKDFYEEVGLKKEIAVSISDYLKSFYSSEMTDFLKNNSLESEV